MEDTTTTMTNANENERENTTTTEMETATDTNIPSPTSHVQSLMTRLLATSPIYNLLLSSITLQSATPGTVNTLLTLTPIHVNSRGSLHGAVSATIIDFTTGLSIASWDLRPTTGASADMHISYLSTAGVGDVLEIVATAERVGGALGFTTCRISKVLEGGGRKLVTIGQHTKYLNLAGGRKITE